MRTATGWQHGQRPLYKSHATSRVGNGIKILIGAVKIIVWSRKINGTRKETALPQPVLVVPVPSLCFSHTARKQK